MMKRSYLLILLLSMACQAPERQQEIDDTDKEKAIQEMQFSQSISQLEEDSISILNLSKDELLGKIEPSQHEGFSRIAAQYTDKEDIYLRQQAYEDFVRMAQAAKEAGIALQIISATRNFAAQKSIWEAKWNGQRKVDGMDLSQAMSDPQQRALKILEYSSMPGTSRHHWGTDMDLNALSNSYFASGEGKKVYDWLLAHAHEYGFCQVYTEKGAHRSDGYNEEKWHWSYMPLAAQFLEQYNQKISYEDLGGFDGGQVAQQIEAIGKYVNGIAPRCLNWEE
ncbi:M15 family metallopeptidase [Catalinimonas niigatensis]|uniref:M15 family metallopeptidase n=1 Tax=Catalinimonas niigatensis TaxID=1397264 RepID=UPI002666CAED|nr:M15 family metallopeptidase [Catalinimonas niigatensis]WPP50082.1 M15 family metallopeptidase [Catalinimonas niigatensis]